MNQMRDKTIYFGDSAEIAIVPCNDDNCLAT